MQDMRIDISTGVILKVLGIGVLMYFLYLVWGILLLLFISLILAALIDPFAGWFEQKRIPRSLAVLLIYVVLIGVIGFSAAVLVPVIAHDLPQLGENLAVALQAVQEHEVVKMLIGNTQELPQGAVVGQEAVQQTNGVFSRNGDVSSALSGVFSTVSGVVTGIFSLLLVLVMTFYLVVQEDPLQKILRSVVPDEYVPYISQLVRRMRDKLGAWLRGQLILSLIVGLLVFIGLLLLGVKYAAVLGLLAALFEFVPYIGPLIAAIPALFFAFTQGGPVLFLAVGLLYIVIQQLENHLLVPKVMQRTVGLNPVVSIVVILIGGKVAGIAGALLAIPVATAASVFLKDVLVQKKHK